MSFLLLVLPIIAATPVSELPPLGYADVMSTWVAEREAQKIEVPKVETPKATTTKSSNEPPSETPKAKTLPTKAITGRLIQVVPEMIVVREAETGKERRFKRGTADLGDIKVGADVTITYEPKSKRVVQIEVVEG